MTVLIWLFHCADIKFFFLQQKFTYRGVAFWHIHIKPSKIEILAEGTDSNLSNSQKSYFIVLSCRLIVSINFELKNFESNKSHINSYLLYFLQLLKNKPIFWTYIRVKFFFIEEKSKKNIVFSKNWIPCMDTLYIF